MRRTNPWGEAEARPDVEVHLAPLPDECGGAAVQRRAGVAYILIDPMLSPVEQRCRLAHELVHLERGSSMRCAWSPCTMDAVIVREEIYVDREVADWLVPLEQLAHVVDGMVRAGVDVTAVAIAEEFMVTKPIARIALDQLARIRGMERLAG